MKKKFKKLLKNNLKELKKAGKRLGYEGYAVRKFLEMYRERLIQMEKNDKK